MDKNEKELVVLVDEDDNELGTIPKSEVHTADTPLHRAFSCFIFKNGQLLLQQRSGKKVTWPLMWSNSVCGHPAPGETTEDAVKRRAQFELGLELTSLKFGAPYRYRFEREGVVENEICPIYIATVNDEPNPNPDEVEVTRWIPWHEFLEELQKDPETYSEWCREEAMILEEQGLVRDLVSD